jgi:hypothetical protein
MTDDRFSNWYFNNTKPLALNYPTPAEDKYFEYQGMLFIKLSAQTPLPKNSAGKTRTFLFSTDSCLFLHGSVQTQFQVHRGGWDINNRTRLGSGLIRSNKRGRCRQYKWQRRKSGHSGRSEWRCGASLSIC